MAQRRLVSEGPTSANGPIQGPPAYNGWFLLTRSQAWRSPGWEGLGTTTHLYACAMLTTAPGG
jgi:hypothetical protein